MFFSALFKKNLEVKQMDGYYSSLKGKRALVTGGAGILAQAMVAGLAQAGADTAAIDCSDHVYTTASLAGAVGITGDLSSPEGCRAAYGKACQALGGEVDILVNAVGIGAKFPPDSFPAEKWQQVLNINLSSYFYMSQLVSSHMLSQGWGRIVNIGSMTCYVAVPDNAAYCSSKGAVLMLTRSLARDWSGRGINVNGIAPGFMDTPLNKIKNDPVEGAATLARIAQGRWGTGLDLVGPLLFFCSDASNYVTGTMLPVDGGYLA